MSEQPPEFYDRLFTTCLEYSKIDPEQSRYVRAWKKVRQHCTGRVADFGCGPGQFARLATDTGADYVLGVDFSPVAISKAKGLNPDLGKFVFAVADLRVDKWVFQTHYDTAVFLEALEHIEDDLSVVACIPAGKRMVFSVPTFTSVSHVRHFTTEADVWCRYRHSIALETVELVPVEFGNRTLGVWVCVGTKLEGK